MPRLACRSPMIRARKEGKCVDNIEYSRTEEFAMIRLARPHRLNAVTPGLVEELCAAFDAASEDAAPAIVLAGAGRAFCAGHDLREPEPVEDARAARARLDRIQDVTRRITAFPGPVLAAVHGYALGAGCEFALGCDLVIAGEDARFGFPETEVGLSVTGGISRLLPGTVGLARAKELLLLGERFDAVRAAELGLVNRVVAEGEHEDAAVALARRLAAKPGHAMTLAKRALDRGQHASLEDALAMEVEHALTTRSSGESERGRADFARRQERIDG